MNNWIQGLSILGGIVIGVVVSLVTQFLTNYFKEKETLKYLSFEFDLNIDKISLWIDEINNYRNALNSDTLDKYFGYFHLSRIASTFYYNTFYSGLLYKFLDFENINDLQVIFSEFSQEWQILMNNQITNNRTSFVSGKGFNKVEVVQQINFWEAKFKTHKKTLEKIKRIFDKKNK